MNYNGSEHLERCLRHIQEQLTDDFELIIVDNASSDRSPKILEQYSRQINVLFSEINLGFGAGANLGLSQAQGEYVTILNSDVFVSAESIKKLASILESSPGTVCVSPRLILEDGTTQNSCRELPYLMGEIAELFGLASKLPEKWGGYLMGKWGHESTRYVEQVAGAAFTTRLSTLNALGGFDSRFPLYYEDVDLCARLSSLGDILYTREITATHLGEATAKKFRKRTTVAIAVSRYRYFLYNKGRCQAEIVRAIGILRALTRIIAIGCVPSNWRNNDKRVKIAGYFAAAWTLLYKPLKFDPLN